MKKKFIFIHEEPNVNLLNLQGHLEAFVDDRLKQFAGTNMSTVWFTLENNRFQWGPIGTEWENAGKNYFIKMKEDATFVAASEEHVRKIGQQIQNAVAPILKNNGKDVLSEAQRVDLIERLFVWNQALCVYGFIGPIMELPHEFVTTEIGRILDTHSQNFVRPKDEYIITLSTPDKETLSIVAQAHLLEIAFSVSQDTNLAQRFLKGTYVADIFPDNHPLADRLYEYLALYPWLIYSYHGPIFDEAKLLEEVRHLLSLPDLARTVAAAKNKLAELRDTQAALAKELQLNQAEEAFFVGARSIAYTKILRKDFLSLSNYTIHLFAKPYLEKYGLTLKDVGVYTVGEFLRLLKTGEKVPEDELVKRRAFLLCVFEPDTVRLTTGIEAKQWLQDNVDFGEGDSSMVEVKGSIASLGKGAKVIRGTIKRVETVGDMRQFKQGDILLSSGTTPDLLPAMRIAGAIVTDTGGLTSHAAIVSRELGVACIIGTKIATKVFKDGEMVEVDAEKGIVRKI